MEFIRVLVKPENPDLDVVFVHGLNPSGSEDHATGTWTYSDGSISNFWPPSLREKLPNARIILFGYNSSVRTNASRTPVHSHAQTLLNRLHLERQEESEKHRRLIFVAHSRGGLLVKEALVAAGIQSSNYGCIRASTKGLVFFATPHGGGNRANLADVAANFASAVTGSAKNSLLDRLKRDSLLNEIATDQFRPQLGDYEVLTFIEAKMMDIHVGKRRIKVRVVPQITSMYIVDPTSAKLGAPQEIALSLNRNHSEICKFSGPEDDEYKLVSGNLKLMARKVQEKGLYCTQCNYDSAAPMTALRYPPIPYASDIPGAPPSLIGRTGRPLPPINTLPLCRPFVGRDELTKKILDTWQKLEGSKPRRISLSGLGGVGKTELSRSIIDQLGPRHFTIWLNAGSDGSLQEDLKTVALSLKDELLWTESGPTQPNAARDGGFFYTTTAPIDYLVGLLRDWLSKAQAREANIPQVLVILDDVDGLESERVRLSKMVSPDGIDVIFSTRDPMIAERSTYIGAISFEVPPLQHDQARDLLCDLTKTNTDTATSSSAETEFLSDIASKLGCLPAALVSQSHYLSDSLATRSQYAQQSYLKNWKSPTDRRRILQSSSTDSYPHSMHTSFTISVQRLRRNTEAKSPELYFCSLNLLRLLSALKIDRFARLELQKLCNPLLEFVQEYGRQNIAESEGEQNDLLVSLGELSKDGTKAPLCVAELVSVSLLTIPDGPDILVLNQLIKECVMLSAQGGSAADKSLKDSGLNQTERLLLEAAARQISKRWAPCLPSPETVGHVGV